MAEACRSCDRWFFGPGGWGDLRDLAVGHLGHVKGSKLLSYFPSSARFSITFWGFFTPPRLGVNPIPFRRAHRGMAKQYGDEPSPPWRDVQLLPGRPVEKAVSPSGGARLCRRPVARWFATGAWNNPARLNVRTLLRLVRPHTAARRQIRPLSPAGYGWRLTGGGAGGNHWPVTDSTPSVRQPNEN